MQRIRQYLERWIERPKVRPWALAGPILVLLITLPLLRPIRHPGEIGEDETARLATVRALVETHSLALDERRDLLPRHVLRINDQIYSDRPPVMAILLAAP